MKSLRVDDGSILEYWDYSIKGYYGNNAYH